MSSISTIISPEVLRLKRYTNLWKIVVLFTRARDHVIFAVYACQTHQWWLEEVTCFPPSLCRVLIVCRIMTLLQPRCAKRYLWWRHYIARTSTVMVTRVINWESADRTRYSYVFSVSHFSTPMLTCFMSVDFHLPRSPALLSYHLGILRRVWWGRAP